MFSRRDVLAASAMSAPMTASAGKAGSFGNPDQPAEGASGTSRLRNENAPGTGVEAPRAQQLGLNDNLMAALPGATTCQPCKRCTSQSQSHSWSDERCLPR